MTIETKFNLGDKVFTMYCDKIIEVTIDKIFCTFLINGMNKESSIRYITSECERTDSKLFASKEELLKSL